MDDDDMYDFGAPAPAKAATRTGPERKAKGTSGGSGGYGGTKERVQKDLGGSGYSRRSDADEKLIDVTPAPKPVHASPGKHKRQEVDDDDYGDDDFEDYGDDFEDEEGSPVRAPAPAPAPAPAAEKGPVNERISSKSSKSSKRVPTAQDENQVPQKVEKAESKSSSGRSSSKPKNRGDSRKGKQFGEVSMSLNIGSFGSGAKAKRLAKLQESGVMDMQMERFTNFSIPSGSPMDRYRRLLASQPPTIRQFGVPAEDESRSVDVATDDLGAIDKSVQYSYGDDTDFLDIMGRIQKAKIAKERGLRLTDKDTGPALMSRGKSQSVAVGTDDDEEGREFSSDSTRLISFLQRASQVCERLIAEDEARSGSVLHVDRSSTGSSLFNAEKQWKNLCDATSGAHELIRTRPATSVSFSSLQPNLLVSTHPYVVGEEDDLLPFKGLYFLWDATTDTNAAPHYVLCSSGPPTCFSFSSTQSFILLGGTADGTLHLWDLREPSSLHKDRDSTDLGIDRGIRKPCFSTPTATFGEAGRRDRGDGDGAGLEPDQHAAPITQIVPIGGGTVSVSSAATVSATSQFASLDTAGVICLWMTTPSKHEEDPGLSPWGRTSLVLTRVLRVGASSTTDSGIPATPTFASIPGDVSTLLASASMGAVNKVVRFGEAPAPSSLERDSGPKLTVSLAMTPRRSSTDGIGVAFHFDVTCIAVQDVHSSSGGSSSSPLVLVGRANCTVDLFQINVSTPMQTWSLDQLRSSRRSSRGNAASLSSPTKSSGGDAIRYVRWLPNKPTAFVIVDSVGTCYVFDLLIDPHTPVCVDELPTDSLVQASISSCRPGTSTAYVSFCDGKGQVHVRPVGENWTRAPDTDSTQLAERLREKMGGWSLRTADTEARVIYKGGSRK